MIRVRFHGRGGHGIKTASRILGTAAFISGYQAQDSPVYGAERRGAGITAYTRIDHEPILERGLIEQPDLIIVGDETLLDDPAAGVLVGQDGASALFVNAESPEAAEQIARAHGAQGRVIGWDVSGRTREVVGRASALSAGLGAAAARLSGLVALDHLRQAVQQELAALGLAPEVIEQNVRLAAEVFAALPSVEIAARESQPSEPLHPVTFDDLILGSPSILAAGNADQRATGSWRIERPEIDRALCTRCGLCCVRCPDGSISLDDEGYPVIDYDHCKGCMICLQQCPVSAIDRQREVRAW
jgi:pyruvate ferredoxin oxidoreductase gamma subunit